MNETREELLFKAQRLRAKYPDRIPVVIVPEKNLVVHKTKLLVPKNISFSNLVATIRTHMECKSHEAIYCMVNNILPPNTALIQTVYNDHCLQDGVMYVHVKKETTFG